MLIISPFKDYYDYVANGTESKPVYNRIDMEKDITFLCGRNVVPTNKYSRLAWYDIYKKKEVLVVCGVGYQYVSTRKDYFKPWNMVEVKRLDIDFSKVYDLPVFLLTTCSSDSYTTKIVIAKAIPHLVDYKFSMFRSAGEVYQDINQFLSYKIPLDPPVSLGNKEKIVKAGFDLKTSFRG